MFTGYCLLGALVSLSLNRLQADELVSVLRGDFSLAENKYIIYDVNRGEGFNLRRDVFMRVTNVVRILRRRHHNYRLVLPPWGGLYHWNDHALQLRWSLFFDVASINQFIPVVEFDQFLKDTNYDSIHEVIYLQAYVEGWSDGVWETKYNVRSCIDGDKYYKFVDGKWRGWFFSFNNVSANKFSCVSIQGDSETLAELLESDHEMPNSIFIDRAEVILHENFGDKYYWQARRSMRYAKKLINIGDLFRKKELNSTDVKDGTILNESWNNTRKKHGDASGGEYICVHWRRRDFVRSHSSHIPSIRGTAMQIQQILFAQQLNTVFLSSDASADEVELLRKYLSQNVTVKQFFNDDGSLLDGEVGIIDQWICAHGRYFVGSHSSTFSYRIQEDREILGFQSANTFNRLCPDQEPLCEQPAKWTIVY